MVGDEQLRDRTATVVGDDIGAVDAEPVHERDDHGHLSRRADVLPGCHFGPAEREKVGRDASANRCKPRDRIAPLEAVQRESVEDTRERNALFVAARYAPEYPETQLDSPELGQALGAIEIILDHHEPYPGFVINRHWDILKTTKGAMRVASFLGGGMHSNMLRQFFDPDDLGAAVANWPDVARDLLRHLHAEIALAPSDRTAKELLAEVFRYPGVPREWRQRNLSVAPTPLLTVVFRKDDRELRFFSAITTFGAPRDVTPDDVRIECAFPADQATAEFCAALR
jgi:MmyB-like transcription regulator ligand binding domain